MRRTLKIVSLSVLCLGVLAAGYTYYLYQSVKDTVSAIYEPLDRTEGTGELAPLGQDTDQKDVAALALDSDAATEEKLLSSAQLQEIKPIDLNSDDPFTMLFLGVDEREHDIGRSDSIIVLTVNPAKHSILMFNIPRDTRTEIVGRGKLDKINHAYAFGGINMAVKTVENFLNIPINYYVKVNMEGFEKIIDILGGVDIDNSFEFTYEGMTYAQGELHLDGHSALMYSRMRHDDPKGDLGRNDRQQKVLANTIDRVKRISTITKVKDILARVEESAKTNLTMDDMEAIYNLHREQVDKINKEEIFGTNAIIDGIYYYSVGDSERTRMHDKIVEQLTE